MMGCAKRVGRRREVVFFEKICYQTVQPLEHIGFFSMLIALNRYSNILKSGGLVSAE